ncbi:ATP-binding protein [Bacillus sp. 1P06AnD]|uniref:ATP-binding protein n=1 Tax=Bacillus sp. 1P06AnD TaxID=3132208 RepID=UPI0039A2C932
MIKNYQYYQKQHHFILKSFMAIISLLLVIGISVSPISWKNNTFEMALQVFLITCILISLFFYIKKDKQGFKSLFIFFITVYLYAKFWTFPETAIMMCLFAMAPLIPIFLFDKISFYIIVSINTILGPFFIYIISQTSLKKTYDYVAQDAFGNTLNFIAIQIILIFVFLGTSNRMAATKAFQKELQQAKQLNSIGQLAATIAHEIRNPITVVKGFAQLLDQEKKLNETDRFYVKTMLTELEHTQLIINDYLSLAKPQTENSQVIELNIEIRKAVDLLSSYANHQNIGIELQTSIPLHVKMNPGELKQVLVNILKNGIEAMQKAGFIYVVAGQAQEMAFIKISDTGVGMSKAQLEQIGTPFYSLKDIGTGIGLTVCYSIIQKYNGKITVESKRNEGTTFIIYIPLHMKG